MPSLLNRLAALGIGGGLLALTAFGTLPDGGTGTPPAWGRSAAAQAAPSAAPGIEARLDSIFAKGRGQFFQTVPRLLEKHFRRDELSAGDLQRLAAAERDIPFLFERIANIAYQKDALIYADLISAGDSASLDRFETMFLALSEDYAGRFVGSLFRADVHADFARKLPQNRGKSTLDIVLQTLGYNVNHSVPAVPESERFRNFIEPDYRSQWAIDAINAGPAWSESRGEGVVVAVLDSGIDPFNAAFEDRLVPGFSFLRRTRPPWEAEDAPIIDHGLHGTGVASALLAIAPECRVMMIRTADSETMNDPSHPSWLYELGAAGIHYAVNHGVQVISKSSALNAAEPAFAEAVGRANENNVSICSSAGNIPRSFLGLPPEESVYDAFDREVLLIGGVQRTPRGIRPWPHSVPNIFVDVAAPSQDVFVLVPSYLKDLKNGYVSGTSLSAPIAAGVVALMRSAAPAPPEILAKPGRYAALITRALKETAKLEEIGLSEPNLTVGSGLIDAAAAIRRLRRLMADDQPVERN